MHKIILALNFLLDFDLQDFCCGNGCLDSIFSQMMGANQDLIHSMQETIENNLEIHSNTLQIRIDRTCWKNYVALSAHFKASWFNREKKLNIRWDAYSCAKCLYLKIFFYLFGWYKNLYKCHFLMLKATFNFKEFIFVCR